MDLNLSRRRFLAGTGALLALPFGLAGRLARAQGARTIRVGLILPSGGDELGTPLDGAVWEAARRGAVMAGEEIDFNAQLLGWSFELLLVGADGPDDTVRAAERLVASEQVCALVGGLGPGDARAISQVAADRSVPFFNVGDPSDALRGEACQRYAFHVEASAATYLDALVAWFVRAGQRDWFIVREQSGEGEDRYRRAVHALTGRHWGAREVGRAVVSGNEGFGAALDAIRRAGPDVVLLLLDAAAQLTFLTEMEASGQQVMVAGFPDPQTQTREYFAALRSAAPRAGAGYRAMLWETTLDAYGARELNARFLGRWNAPMDGPAWATYAALKILFETVLAEGSQDGDRLVARLETSDTVFDVYKGIGVSFRPWDHQLRQPVYLVKVRDDVEPGSDPQSLGLLVGQLPEIYMPGTDPVERLDQLGDLAEESRCRLGQV